VLAKAHATAADLGDDVAVLHVLRLESDVLHGAGRYAAAAATARRGLEVCAAAGLARTTGPIHAANLAEPLIALGDWDEAVRIIEDALGHPPIPGLDAYLLLLHGTIRLARGDLAGAGEAVTYAREVFARGYPDTQDLLPLIRLEVDLAVAEGRPAAPIVTDALALPDIETTPRYLWPLLVSAAHVPDLLPRLRPLAAGLSVVGPVQEANRLTFTALAESTSAAWDRAAAAWAELAEPYASARAMVSAAVEAADPAERLRAAAANAESLGATPLLAEIDRIARLRRVSTEAAADRHGLTERELEVLRLLADGHTNRQIAQELFISAKTVSTHVSNILTKLAVPGRVQAATAAHRLNLLPG
jgi:DNA-binding CsgD family transcriptional regulator